MANILIADDHKLLLDTLGTYLTEALEGIDVQCVDTLAEAERVLADENSDLELAIIDYRMPHSRGISTIRKLLENKAEVPIAVMSGLALPEEVVELLNVGIIGFLPKAVSGVSITHAVRLMLSGERYVPASVFSPSRTTRSNNDQSVTSPLSDRETSILRLLRLGHTNKEIGRHLGIEEVTVKQYVSRLGKRFGSHNRVQILMAAIERGIVE